MSKLKTIALAAGAVARSVSFPGGEPAATVLLHHRFLRPGEPRSKALDRLRRQLDWLRSAYRPVGVPDLAARFTAADALDRSVVVTTDDALLDILEVAEEFGRFEVPLAVFACAGWVACESGSHPDDLLMRLVACIQWYEGEDRTVQAGGGWVLALREASKASNIDFVIENWNDVSLYAEELFDRIQSLPGAVRRRPVCTWSDLQELSSSGVYVGAHSVSHVPIARMSAVRQRFEIAECRRALDARLGAPKVFAYPYGMRGTFDASTSAELTRAGFELAFASHSGVVTASSPAFELPRITLPDEPMSLFEYKARVRGGGILAREMKEKLRKAR